MLDLLPLRLQSIYVLFRDGDNAFCHRLKLLARCWGGIVQWCVHKWDLLRDFLDPVPSDFREPDGGWIFLEIIPSPITDVKGHGEVSHTVGDLEENASAHESNEDAGIADGKHDGYGIFLNVTTEQILLLWSKSPQTTPSDEKRVAFPRD